MRGEWTFYDPLMSLFRRSRCVDAAFAPQHLHWAEVEGDPHLVQRELVQAVKDHVDATIQPEVLAEIQATLESIATCTAVEPSQVEAVARDSMLFELKISLTAWGVLLRVYETEDPRLPRHLVALRSHQKIVDVPPHEIEARQNAEIDVASERWAAGRDHLWGLG